LSAKGFKNTIRCCPNPFENFPDFSGNFFIFSLSLFYLLEGSKIFFMSTKYFIWIVRVSICLWEVSWKFLNFLSIFRDFKHFQGFSWICFALENNFEKNIKPYPSHPGRARRPDRTPPTHAPTLSCFPRSPALYLGPAAGSLVKLLRLLHSF
jgi:hypothetical protein